MDDGGIDGIRTPEGGRGLAKAFVLTATPQHLVDSAPVPEPIVPPWPSSFPPSDSSNGKRGHHDSAAHASVESITASGVEPTM